MTVREMREWLADEEMFFDPEGRFEFQFEGKPIEIGTTTMFGTGHALVKMNPCPKKKFMFSLKFEANPVIEAETLEEAEKLAADMMRDCAVTKVDRDGEHFVQNDYEAQEPYFLEEVQE